jgi:hypothetical protein
MRRFGILALALALCGASACDDDNPTSPTAGPIVFTVDLAASNEVPAVSNAESGGTGRATITFNVPRDGSGNITDGGTWNVQAVVSGLTANTVIQRAHIHNGPAGQNANVFVDTLLTPANSIPVNVSGTLNFEGVPISAAQAQAVVANPAGHYFNMHSTLNPGGVVRGQMVRLQ